MSKKKAVYKNKGIVFFIALLILFAISEYANLQNQNIPNQESSINIEENIKESGNINEEPKEEKKEINDSFQIYFFDVGQGDSILIRCDGENMLIDAGNNPDGSLIVNYLKDELHINKLDYLVGTHPHEDHIGGLDNVINNFEIGKIYMPKKSSTTKTFEDVLDATSNKNLTVKAPSIGDKFNLGSASCEFMEIDSNAKEVNQSSIVIEVTYGTQKYLFTGDTESINEEKREWNDVDVLKVAHHGSNSSTSEEFLSQTNPEIAIISVGKDNSYYHPHKITLDKLEKVNAQIYRTDLDGTILLTSDGKNNIIKKLKVSLDGNI